MGKVLRLVMAAAAGAVVSGLAVLVMYGASPSVTLDMDRPLGTAASGFFPDERVERETFAWTRRTATVDLDGLDRRIPWVCTVRIKGGRADVSTLPEAVATVDGIIVSRLATNNDYQDLKIPLAAQPGHSGATVSVTLSNTFRPPSDPRDLGALIDRWACTPAEGGWPIVPRQALTAAALVGAAFGVALALLGVSVALGSVGLLAVAIAVAMPMSTALGPFGEYPGTVLSFGLAVAGVLTIAGLAAIQIGRPLSMAARVVLAISAIVLLAKLLALLHPSKLIVDAVFHAHRLQWVLEGRFYFTQVMPSGVRFPYAIGLYVFAAPWSLLTTDFVTLLRVIVVGAEVLTGIFAYVLVSRYWQDRTAGAWAVVLLALVPRTFEIVGNANMTNAFGQSMAFAVLAVATLWSLRWGQWRPWLGLTALTTAALLCHISTFMLLGVILVVLVGLYWWSGDKELKSSAWSIATALAVASVIAIVVYYGHFAEAYRSAARVSTAGDQTIYASLSAKAFDVARLTVQGLGWPLFLLGLVGAVHLWTTTKRDRLTRTVATLGISLVVLGIAVTVTPVEQSFQRYNAEFFSRVILATYPAFAIAGALGGVALWRRAGVWRGAAVVAFSATVWVGWSTWTMWLG